MKFSKILAAFSAVALSVSMLAVNAAAETVTIDEEYAGSWVATGNGITKEQLQAVGGDVKIVLDVEVYNPYGLADQMLINPIDYDNGWLSQTIEFCTSDTLTAKVDGWICVNKDDTQLEFVYDAAGIDALGDSGLCFSAQNVTVKSATYTLADSKQGEINFVSDKEGKEYCLADLDRSTAAAEEAVVEEAPAVVEEAASEEAASVEAVPVVVETTTSTTTGNTSAAAIAVVMIAAGAAALVSKRK